MISKVLVCYFVAVVPSTVNYKFRSWFFVYGVGPFRVSGTLFGHFMLLFRNIYCINFVCLFLVLFF